MYIIIIIQIYRSWTSINIWIRNAQVLLIQFSVARITATSVLFSTRYCDTSDFPFKSCFYLFAHDSSSNYHCYWNKVREEESRPFVLEYSSSRVWVIPIVVKPHDTDWREARCYVTRSQDENIFFFNCQSVLCQLFWASLFPSPLPSSYDLSNFYICFKLFSCSNEPFKVLALGWSSRILTHHTRTSFFFSFKLITLVIGIDVHGNLNLKL